MAKHNSSRKLFKIVEECQVCPPPPASPTEIPLTFFDLPWLLFPPAQSLFFYPYPHPTSHFLSTTAPTLKHSLSLALQRFFPFAAHLVLLHSNSSAPPKLVYHQKHSYVSLTLAESDADFHHISGNHPRHVEELHPLVPWLQREGSSDDDDDDNQTLLPLLAIKVTVFPNTGLCIGLAYHHVAADGRTFDNFIKTWAAFNKEPCSSFSVMVKPCLDRTVVTDQHGLEAIFLKEWREKKPAQHLKPGTYYKVGAAAADKVRATFVMGLADMEKVKRWIVTQCKNRSLSEPKHLSPYVLTCAFVWVCLTKAKAKDEDEEDEEYNHDYPCYFGFNAGGINRLDYHVPATYVGNCVGFGRCEASRRELMGESGIVVAAKAMADTIKKLDKALLGEAERWISEWEVFFGSELHVVAVGSPKVGVYDTDFGWGRPTKIEEISIDAWQGGGAISLTQSRDNNGSIEVGLALPSPLMDAFSSLFAHSLT